MPAVVPPPRRPYRRPGSLQPAAAASRFAHFASVRHANQCRLHEKGGAGTAGIRSGRGVWAGNTANPGLRHKGCSSIDDFHEGGVDHAGTRRYRTCRPGPADRPRRRHVHSRDECRAAQFPCRLCGAARDPRYTAPPVIRGCGRFPAVVSVDPLPAPLCRLAVAAVVAAATAGAALSPGETACRGPQPPAGIGPQTEGPDGPWSCR